jgi:hypothetical protein
MAQPTKIYLSRNVLDVFISSPADGALLVYNSGSGVWVGGNISVDDLGDVATGSEASGQLLIWNGSNWVNVDHPHPALNGLADVLLTSPADMASLQYQISSGSWIDRIYDLNDLADMSVGTPADGMSIFWNDGSGKWEAQLPSSGSFVTPVILLVYNEKITTTGSGFTTAYEFVPNSLQVWWNGVRQGPDHFDEDNDHLGFTTEFIVVSGDELVVDYARPTSGSEGAVHIQDTQIWSALTPPDDPGTQDDEFDDIADWTEIDQGSYLACEIQDYGTLLTFGSSGADGMAGLWKLAPSDPYSAWTKVRHHNKGSSEITGGILLIEDKDAPATSNMILGGWKIDSYDSAFVVLNYADYQTETSVHESLVGFPLPSMFTRVRIDSGSAGWDISNDGVSWVEMHITELPFTPEAYGIGVASPNTNENRVSFPFFRMTSGSDLGWVGGGNKIWIDRV